MIPRTIIFDLDNTLAESKQPLTPEMLDLLEKLLERTRVAIISGGALSQLTAQAAGRLAPNADFAHFYLLPTSGAALYSFSGDDMEGLIWNEIYKERLTDEEAAIIAKEVRAGAVETGLIDFSVEQYGQYIENRGSQVSLSALGQLAPPDVKKAWDPTREKRNALQAAIAPRLPEYDVKVGGLTTIDVTRHGINKAYGVRQLSEYLDIPISEMLYVGDELEDGGNDAVVIETGIPTHAVKNPEETAQLIQSFISAD